MDLNGVRFIYTQVHKTLIVNCCLQFITLVYEAEEVNKILLNCYLFFSRNVFPSTQAKKTAEFFSSASRCQCHNHH
jgi:hypothetical protein